MAFWNALDLQYASFYPEPGRPYGVRIRTCQNHEDRLGLVFVFLPARYYLSIPGKGRRLSRFTYLTLPKDSIHFSRLDLLVDMTLCERPALPVPIFDVSSGECFFFSLSLV